MRRAAAGPGVGGSSNRHPSSRWARRRHASRLSALGSAWASARAVQLLARAGPAAAGVAWVPQVYLLAASCQKLTAMPACWSRKPMSGAAGKRLIGGRGARPAKRCNRPATSRWTRHAGPARAPHGRAGRSPAPGWRGRGQVDRASVEVQPPQLQPRLEGLSVDLALRCGTSDDLDACAAICQAAFAAIADRHAFPPDFPVRPDGACHQWRKVPPRELSVDLVADERRVWATGRVEAS